MSKKDEFTDATLPETDNPFTVVLMCRSLTVSKSGFYHRVSRPILFTATRRTQPHQPRVLITDEAAGYRRVHALTRQGVQVGPELVRHLIRNMGLQPCQPRPWRHSLTQADPAAPPIPDLVARDFTHTAPGTTATHRAAAPHRSTRRGEDPVSTDPTTTADHDGFPGFEPDDRLGAAEMVVDPRLDSEALCLCGLLWSTPTGAGRVVAVLQADDFLRPTHGELFTVVADQLRQQRPHDPASIAAVGTDLGTGARRGGLLTTALAAATTAGAAPEAAGHHAVNMITAAYRRSFHTAAVAMAQAAEQLPTNALFDHLVDVGRAQRTATARLHHARTTLDGSRTP